MHLLLHQQEMEALASQLLTERDFDFIAITDDGVVAASPTQFRVDLDAGARSQYEGLLKDAGVSYMARHHEYEGHAFVETGSGERFGRDFGGLLLYGPGPSTPLCRNQFRTSESGWCHFELSDRWHLHYGWVVPAR